MLLPLVFPFLQETSQGICFANTFSSIFDKLIAPKHCCCDEFFCNSSGCAGIWWIFGHLVSFSSVPLPLSLNPQDLSWNGPFGWGSGRRMYWFAVEWVMGYRFGPSSVDNGDAQYVVLRGRRNLQIPIFKWFQADLGQKRSLRLEEPSLLGFFGIQTKPLATRTRATFSSISVVLVMKSKMITSNLATSCLRTSICLGWSHCWRWS